MLDKWVLLNAWCFVMFSARVHLWKFLIFEKVLPREQGLSEGQVFKPESSLGGKGLGVKQKHTCSAAVYGHRDS